MGICLKQRFNLQKKYSDSNLTEALFNLQVIWPYYLQDWALLHEMVDLEKEYHGWKKGFNVWEASE